MSKSARPIILGSFSRGGSSLVWNIIQSHPDAIGLLQETHQFLIGNSDTERRRVLRLRSMMATIRHASLPRPRIHDYHVFPNLGLFSPSNYGRRPVSGRIAATVGSIIESGTAEAVADSDYGLIAPGRGYEDTDVSSLRPVLKNINGVIFLHDSMRLLEPASQCVLLIRDGLSLLEGRIRRRTITSPHKFGVVYGLMIEEMARQVEANPDTVVVSFEDLVRDPVEFSTSLFDLLSLRGVPDWIRLKNKRFVGDDSSGRPALSSDRVTWTRFGELRSAIGADVDGAQRNRVSREDRADFLRGAGDAPELARLLTGGSG